MARKAATKKAAAKDEGKSKVATEEQKEVGTQGPSNEPENAMSDIKDHSVTSDEMAEKRGGKKSKLAASDETTEQLAEETKEEKEDLDNSVYGRLARSGYVLNEVQMSGDRYIGRSIQLEPDIPIYIKNNTRITNIAEVRPFKGLQVRPMDGGEPFAVPEEFDKDATPRDWLGIINPATKKNFIEA